MIEINGKLYSYSLKFHATAQRRNVLMTDVESVLQSPDERSASEHDPQNRWLYSKLIDHRWISVVVDETEQMLITVWANEE